MRTEHPRRRTGRHAVAVAVLAAALLGAPAVAEAAFVAIATTNVAGGRTSATTMTLDSPSPNSVLPACTQQGNSNKYSLVLTVLSHGTVTRATGYILTVYNVTGTVGTVDLSVGNAYTSTKAEAGWKYSIDAIYKVSSTNTWRSNSAQIAVCP